MTEPPSAFASTTSTVPTAFAGVRHATVSAADTFTFVQSFPAIRTVRPGWKPVPLMVMLWPPAVGPPFGVTDTIVGSCE